MKNEQLNKLYGEYDSSFQYMETTFIIDKYQNGFLVSECRMLVKTFNSNLETAKKEAMDRYNEVMKDND